jgi:predicted membrane protein
MSVALMTDMKIAVFALVGALLGIVIASLIVPPALSWYSAPGGLPQGTQIQAIVEIPTVIRYATAKLIRGQMIGAVIGALVGLVTAVIVSRKGSAVDVHRGTPA